MSGRWSDQLRQQHHATRRQDGVARRLVVADGPRLEAQRLHRSSSTAVSLRTVHGSRKTGSPEASGVSPSAMRSIPNPTAEDHANDYRGRLTATWFRSPNFAGTEQTSGGGLILFGVGTAPPAIQRIMDLAPDGVEVEWRSVAHTLSELDSELVRILGAFPQLMSGGPASDCEGLEFTTNDDALLSAANPQAVLGTAFRVTISFGGPAVAW